MNAKVTNALRKNIFIGSRHYKNVLLWFNHEFSHSEHPAQNKKKKMLSSGGGELLPHQFGFQS